METPESLPFLLFLSLGQDRCLAPDSCYFVIRPGSLPGTRLMLVGNLFVDLLNLRSHFQTRLLLLLLIFKDL